MLPHSFTFPKSEHLSGEIRIAKLFSEGKAFICYPLRVVFSLVEKEKTPAKVLVSVPKKRCKKAVKRNKIRRMIKEAYRLHKEALINQLSTQNFTLHMAITYVSDEEIPYAQIEKKMIEALLKIVQNPGLK